MKCKVISITLVIITLIVLVPSIMEINKIHNEKLYLVTEKRIIEASIMCIKEEICNNDKIYLEILYENDYLEYEFNPISKEYYSNLSYVLIDEEKTEFVSVY